MSRVEELEGRIQSLSPDEFQELRAWLAEHDAGIWDRQLETDAFSGRLEAIADRALRDFSQGRSTDL